MLRLDAYSSAESKNSGETRVNIDGQLNCMNVDGMGKTSVQWERATCRKVESECSTFQVWHPARAYVAARAEVPHVAQVGVVGDPNYAAEVPHQAAVDEVLAEPAHRMSKTIRGTEISTLAKVQALSQGIRDEPLVIAMSERMAQTMINALDLQSATYNKTDKEYQAHEGETGVYAHVKAVILHQIDLSRLAVQRSAREQLASSKITRAYEFTGHITTWTKLFMILYDGEWTPADRVANSIMQKRMCVQLNQSLDETSTDMNLQRMKEIIAEHTRTTGFDTKETLRLLDQHTSFAAETGYNPYVPTAEQAMAMREEHHGKKQWRKSGSFIFQCFNCGGDHLLTDCTEDRDEATIRKNRNAFHEKKKSRKNKKRAEGAGDSDSDSNASKQDRKKDRKKRDRNKGGGKKGLPPGLDERDVALFAAVMSSWHDQRNKEKGSGSSSDSGPDECNLVVERGAVEDATQHMGRLSLAQANPSKRSRVEQNGRQDAAFWNSMSKRQRKGLQQFYYAHGEYNAARMVPMQSSDGVEDESSDDEQADGSDDVEDDSFDDDDSSGKGRAAVIFFDTLATIVCIQNLEQGFIDRVRSNSIRLVFGEKIESN